MHPLIPAPQDPAARPAWREQLQQWRRSTRVLIGYDGSLYDRPEFTWARRNYVCYFLMMTEQAWLDRANGRFDTARFLRDMEERYGGVDSVLLWNAYPCIGIDPRNQYDLYRDWPGGLKGVRAVVGALHAAGGTTGRLYPWGDAMAEGLCNGGRSSGTTPVDAFPAGAAPSGAEDLCGNVWELTESERADGRNRHVILKGGSWFNPLGSMWYVEGGPQPIDWGTKLLLAWPGLDRSATIGFRCVRPLD